MDETEMIDFYEELIETLQSLNRETPKVRELYDNVNEVLTQALSDIPKTAEKAQEELNKAETAGINRVTKLSSERKKQIDEQIKALDKSINNASKLQKALDLSADYVQQVEEQFEELTEYIEQLESIIDEQQSQFGKLEQRIMLLEGRFNEIQPSIEIDYEELSTAINLFNKYNGRIGRPVVLEKPNYINDYCFRVSDIDEEEKVLIGRFYRQGELYGRKNTFPFSTRCRMFNGDTLEDVITGEI